jgi:hypothetical protein
MRACRWSIVAMSLALFVLAGCASHEVVPSSGPRAATTPAQVKIYQDFPKKYEELKVINLTITPEMKLDERASADAAFEALKAQAAAAGANGILLKVDAGTYDFLVTAGCKGTFYQVPARRSPKTAVVKAIFVLDE